MCMRQSQFVDKSTIRNDASLPEKEKSDLLGSLPQLFNLEFQKEKVIPSVFICSITNVG